MNTQENTEVTEVSEKQAALAKYLEVSPEEITQGYDENNFECNGEEYLVLTDSEADQAWDESLDNYIEECLMPEIQDENLKRYFDTDAWKRDAKFDGRGHSLSGYDGNEIELEGDLYAYRTN